MSKDKDHFFESDLPESIPHIEEWLDSHKNEIVNFVEGKISEKSSESSKSNTIRYIYTNSQHKNPLCRVAAIDSITELKGKLDLSIQICL
jgi:hypothetical protein